MQEKKISIGRNKNRTGEWMNYLAFVFEEKNTSEVQTKKNWWERKIKNVPKYL